MYPSVWTPHMTVAAVVERDGRFLMVEEFADGERVFNQPAGHLEPGEGLLDAVVREVREETGTRFFPEGVIGVYRWVNPGNGETHVRIAFNGPVEEDEDAPELDDPIIARHWLDYDELQAHRDHLRSPLVLGCIDDYRLGARYPLELLRELA